MIIAIVGYDLRALSLARIFKREGNIIHIVPGFRNIYSHGLFYHSITNEKIPLYEQVKKIDEIYLILNNIKPDLVVCLHVESYDSGLVDYLKKNHFCVFGVNRLGSSIETSKIIGLEFARQSGLKTPKSSIIKKLDKQKWFSTFDAPYPIVIKLDGLSGGRGTFIVNSHAELKTTLSCISSDFIVQEFIKGHEIAFSLLVNNGNIDVLNINFEIKKKIKGDVGENTPGMGTVARNVFDLKQTQIIKLLKKIPINLYNINYQGPIDISFILDKVEELVFLEFTTRFGDPELSSELLLIDNITELFYSFSLNKPYSIKFKPYKWAVGVVARGRGNSLLPKPSTSRKKNYIIDALDFDDYQEVCVSATGNNYTKMLNNIYKQLASLIEKKMHYRDDIHITINDRWNNIHRLIK